jgi:DNA repair protein RecO
MEIFTEAITLSSVAYKERSRIIKIFSKQEGIISLIIKGFSRKKTLLFSLSSPFCVAEFKLKKNRGDIYSFYDGNIIDANLHLRNSLKKLRAATSILQAISSSQFPNKKAENLYLLTNCYINKMAIFPNPEILLASFYLKLLANEGYIKIQRQCNQCLEKAVSISGGESLCINHKSFNSINFNEEEFSKLFILTHAKEFKLLEDIDISSSFKEKIELVFKTFFS